MFREVVAPEIYRAPRQWQRSQISPIEEEMGPIALPNGAVSQTP